MTESYILVHFDGSCLNNPGGPGGWGFSVSDLNGVSHKKFGKLTLKNLTNNEAEFIALIQALKWLEDNKYQDKRIIIKGDSNLVIKMTQGKWKTVKPNLKLLKQHAREMIATFRDLTLKWVPRTQNKFADALSKVASGK